MGVSVIDDGEFAAFYDNTTMVAFGPIIDSIEDDPEDFREWLEEEGVDDIRDVSVAQLTELYEQYRDEA